ncbi:hypothetical protein [Vibrio campbellii]|uniref:hypothetical protein n=1 Tax=Vibrio campbellii TaxID=680 RepID=UPI00314BDDFB
MSEPSLLISFATLVDSNKEWLFSGIGIVAISLTIKHLSKNRKDEEQAQSPLSQSGPVINVNVENNNESKANSSNSSTSGIRDLSEEVNQKSQTPSESMVKDESYFKKNTKILIIDDEVQFKLPKIFRDSGWVNTKLVPDVNSVNSPEIVEADILFVDVQGVGKELGFKDEGLGLVAAIKNKFPNKKVVIYSVIAEGNRFHEAFNLCDGCLSKDADPYQFECLVEKFTIHKGLYE